MGAFLLGVIGVTIILTRLASLGNSLGLGKENRRR